MHCIRHRDYFWKHTFILVWMSFCILIIQLIRRRELNYHYGQSKSIDWMKNLYGLHTHRNEREIKTKIKCVHKPYTLYSISQPVACMLYIWPHKLRHVFCFMLLVTACIHQGIINVNMWAEFECIFWRVNRDNLWIRTVRSMWVWEMMMIMM